MNRLDKVRLVAVVCAGTSLQLSVAPDLRLMPFVLAYAAYRSGTLLTEARLGRGGA